MVSVIHFELIFVYGVRQEYSIILWWILFLKKSLFILKLFSLVFF